MMIEWLGHELNFSELRNVNKQVDVDNKIMRWSGHYSLVFRHEQGTTVVHNIQLENNLIKKFDGIKSSDVLNIEKFDETLLYFKKEFKLTYYNGVDKKELLTFFDNVLTFFSTHSDINLEKLKETIDVDESTSVSDYLYDLRLDGINFDKLKTLNDNDVDVTSNILIEKIKT